jgi:hypothetical protein
MSRYILLHVILTLKLPSLPLAVPMYIVGRYLSVPSSVLRSRLKSFSLLSKMGYDPFFSLCYSWCDTCSLSRRLPYQHFRFSVQKRDDHTFLLISLILCLPWTDFSHFFNIEKNLHINCISFIEIMFVHSGKN